MIAYQTKAELAYEVLLEGITKGIYKPGEKLIIRQLSKELDVSEIPIREAIKRLESEGYVIHDVNKSVTVCTISTDELTNFFQIRGVLEGYASRMSIDCLEEKDVDEIQKINEEMKTAYRENRTDLFSALNEQFHMRIYQKNPNSELIKLIENLWKKWSITKQVFTTSPERIGHSIKEHDEIIRLIRAKKYDDLENFVRNHKFRAGAEMVASLQKE